MDGAVREWIGTQDAPNLYWPLAALPRPFVDISGSMQRELTLLVEAFPALKRPRAITGDQLQPIVDELRQLAPDDQLPRLLADAATVAQSLPRARAWLAEEGVAQADIEKILPRDAVARYFAWQFTTLFHDIQKHFTLPYPQGIVGLEAMGDQVRQARERDSNPLTLIVPATSRAFASSSAVDREIAMLQTVEAIRAFASGSGGRLPVSLDELSDMPAPRDPMTGEPFPYEQDGDVQFVLATATPPGGDRVPGARIEVKIAK
jgi:hypothetical protein